MWLLRNEDKGSVYRVHPGKPNVISRKDGDLLLLGDQSISRKHAEITVHSENQRGGIVLKDLGSKYGTFAMHGGGEPTQVSPNEPITMNNGDAVRFGIQHNIWRVEYFPVIVATSTLNAGEKTEVKEVVAALGGEMVNDWQVCCTHLTMNKLTVTVKVVCALACGKPIVVPGYWKALQDALATQTKLPDCQDFVPPLAEALLDPSEVSFTPNPERGKLFSGYTFVAASTKQLSRIKPMITAAGGNAVEFCASVWPDSKLMSDKVVLMHHTAGDKQGSQQSQVPDGYIAAARKLKAAGVRCVPESEIGLSIVHCSVAQYCNPRFSQQSLFGGSATQNTQQITVVCPSTEDSMKPQQNGVMAGSATTSNKKRALEESSEEEQLQHPSKKTNSEDIFGSEAVEAETERNWNLPSTSLSKSGLKNKQPIVNPSLDMFAPSGQISGQSGQNRNILNKATTSTSENLPKARQPIVNPSLDMFAPSGQISNKENKSEVNPSCQDMFASNESRQTQEKKRSSCNEPQSVPNKQPRAARLDEENDEFSFATNKKTSKLKKTTLEKDDEFSFVSNRKSNRRPVIGEEDGDEFSFASTRKGNHQKMAQDPVDEFSFVSSKSAKKRNRQSNPDMFDSNDECLASNGRASTSHAKNNNCNMAPNENQEENDDLFAFAGGPAPKRRKDTENIHNTDESDAEVKLALFSKKDNASLPPQTASEPNVFEEPANEKNLVTFSKDKTCPVRIKEEVTDDEVDSLAKELHNATIVVVKPLVVVRQKPSEAQPTSGGKNFKKFRKVTGINKRIVPHIIGGSDLVPHYANSHNIDDVLPPSPPSVTPDDDWGFPNEKKKGKNR